MLLMYTPNLTAIKYKLKKECQGSLNILVAIHCLMAIVTCVSCMYWLECCFVCFCILCVCVCMYVCVYVRACVADNRYFKWPSNVPPKLRQADAYLKRIHNNWWAKRKVCLMRIATCAGECKCSFASMLTMWLLVCAAWKAYLGCCAHAL